MTDPIVAAMREVAGPHLYKGNAFRITGVHTDAARPAVQARRRKIVTELEVGVATGLQADPADIARAFELILNDPHRRLVHELFGPWSTPSPACSCPVALHHDHDAAIRLHSKALKAEQKSRMPGEAERRRLDQLWANAGTAWEQQARRVAFWDHLRERIAALDERQLDESAVGRMRDELTATLIRPLLQLAAAGGFRQADRGRVARGWPGGAGFVDAQLEKIAEPLYEEIRTDLRRLTEKLGAAGPPEATVQELRKTVRPKLDRLTGLVPADRHRATARTSNDVATLFNNCAIRQIDRLGAGADSSAGAWLGTAADLATDPQTTATIEQNRATLATLVAAGEMAGGKMAGAGRPWDPVPRRPPIPVPERPRRSFWDWFDSLVVWGLIFAGLFWLIARCDSGDHDTGGPAVTISVPEGRGG